MLERITVSRVEAPAEAEVKNVRLVRRQEMWEWYRAAEDVFWYFVIVVCLLWICLLAH